MKVTYHLRSPKAVRSAVRLHVSVDGYRLRHPLPIEVPVDKWDKTAQRPRKRSYPGSGEHRHLLDALAAEFVAHLAELRLTGATPEPEEMKRWLDVRTGATTPRTAPEVPTLDVIAAWIDATPNLAEGTRRSHRQTLNRVRRFQTTKRAGEPFTWDTVDLDWYNEFVAYCYAPHVDDDGVLREGLSANSVGGVHIKHVKTWLTAHEHLHQNREHHRRAFKRPRAETDKTALTETQLSAVLSVELPEGLARVRDLFALGCLTGLRISDYSALNPANRVTYADADGRDCPAFKIRTQKTGEVVTLPLHPEAERILKRHGGSAPRTPTSQAFNRMLKEVCCRAGLTEVREYRVNVGGANEKQRTPLYKRVTSHAARRTFITLSYFAGVPEATLAKVVGHAAVIQTLEYIRAGADVHAALMGGNAKWRAIGLGTQGTES